MFTLLFTKNGYETEEQGGSETDEATVYVTFRIRNSEDDDNLLNKPIRYATYIFGVLALINILGVTTIISWI